MRFRSFALLCLGWLATTTVAAQGYDYTTQYYRVKFPDDLRLTGCNLTPPPVQMPEIERYASCNFNVGISVKDQYYYTNGSKRCYKILRRYRLVDWCVPYHPSTPMRIFNPTHTDQGAEAYGNAYNYGYLEYEQVIQVVDEQAPRFVNCPTSPTVLCDYTPNDPKRYNNGYRDLCEAPLTLRTAVTDGCSGAGLQLRYFLYLDMDGNGTMERFINSANLSDTMVRPVQLTVQNDTVYATLAFPSWFEVPHGRHKIEWIASDDCGNVSACKYEFEIRDCSAPSIVCLRGLSTPIMQTGMAMVDMSLFRARVSDNCTPTAQLEMGIKRAQPNDIAFPVGQTVLTFDCTQRDTQNVQIWVRDRAGNATYCETYILIQDADSVCQRRPLQGGVAERSEAPTAFNSGVTPNPVRDGQMALTFTLTQPEPVTVRVWNAAGQLVYQQQGAGTAGTQRWPLALPRAATGTGWMVVQLISGTRSAVHRVLVSE